MPLIDSINNIIYVKVLMIDITNKSVEEINSYIQTYSHILEVVKYKEKIPYLAVIIDMAVKHIANCYNNLTSDWKAWSVYVVEELCDIINNEIDVKNIINEFNEYYQKEYQKFLDNIAMSVSDYDRDWAFIHTFMKNKNY